MKTTVWIAGVCMILAAMAVQAAGDSMQNMPGMEHMQGMNMEHGHEQRFSFGHPATPRGDSVVKIDAQDTMRFTPATIAIKPGGIIRFEVTNTGKIVHEFVIGDATEQKEHEAEMQAMTKKMPGMAMHDDANGISIAPGETKSITWQFPDKPMKVAYACHEPGHFAAGMVGIINVVGH